MPTYEYACTACGHHLEVVQSFSDDPLSTCPECGGALRKVFGSIGIVLKGSGFYKTDNRSASRGAARESAPGTTGEAATGGGEPKHGGEGSQGDTTKKADSATGTSGAASPTAASPSPAAATSSA